jgi:hypothetical protein
MILDASIIDIYSIALANTINKYALVLIAIEKVDFGWACLSVVGIVSLKKCTILIAVCSTTFLYRSDETGFRWITVPVTDFSLSGNLVRLKLAVENGAICVNDATRSWPFSSVESALIVITVRKNIFAVSLLRAIDEGTLINIAFVMIVVSANAVFTVIQPVPNIFVVVWVDILTFTTFDSFVDLSFIFFSIWK